MHEFRLAHLSRAAFAMYPEERLGLELNSTTMMWEDVEAIFVNIRQCMSTARQGTSSATFKIPLSIAAFAFWKVTKTYLGSRTVLLWRNSNTFYLP